MKKKLASILLVIAMLMSLLAVPVSAETSSTTTASGTCGENLTWELTEDGTLTISGTGDMYDYGEVSLYDLPWYSYREYITTVVVEDGVTSIGDAAFYELYNLTTVSLGSDITSIGSSAFQLCSSLTKVVIPDGVTEIPSYAFCQCTSLKRVTIPAAVDSIGYWAFYMCDSLATVDYIGTLDMWHTLKSNADEGNESLTQATILCREQTYYGVQNTASNEDEDLVNLLKELFDNWETAYADYTDAVDDALDDAAASADTDDTREQVIAAEAAAMKASDEANTTGNLYVSGLSYADEDVKNAVYEAYATFLYDDIASCEDIDLSSISATDANASKLVTTLMKHMVLTSETYEIGKVTVSIVPIASFGSNFSAKVTATYQGETINGYVGSSVASVQTALTNFIDEMIDLESSALFQIYDALYTDILGTSIQNLTSKYLAEKLNSTVVAKLPSEIGDLANDLSYCYNFWSLAQQAESALNSGRDTAELEAIYTSMSAIKFKDDGISSRAVASAWKKVKNAAETLSDAYGSYCAGTLDLSQYATWYENVGATIQNALTWIKGIFTCPVNVAIYDSTGTMIGYAGDDDTWYTDGLCYIEEADDAVIVYIFTDDEVTFEVTATGYGTVGCSFETYNDDGTPVGRTNYYDIVVETGQTITASVTGEDGASGCSVALEGSVITADEYISAEDDASVAITCEIEGSGEVSGTGTYVRGDAVVLTATPDDDYVFIAWMDGDEIISTNRVCEFTAKDDTEVTAIFRSTAVTRDIVLVLDVSGSMRGDSLANTKTAATAFVNQILGSGSNIQIAIVTYSTSYTTVCELTDDQDTLLAAIDSLSAYGSTNIYGGLSTAGSILASSTADKKAIVIMTDGEANKGTTSSSGYVTTEEGDTIYLTNYGMAIYNLATTYKSDDYGYTIYSLGFGLTEDSNAYNLIKYISSLDEDGNRYFWSVTNDNVDDLVFTYTDIADTVTVTEKSIKIVIECPVEASVTLDEETLDKDNLTASFGSVTVTEVSDGYQYVFLLDDNPDYDIQIEGIDNGYMDLTVYYYSDDDFEYRAFENVPITVSTVATTNGTDRDEELILILDSDGDGTTDNSWSADENEIITIELPTYTVSLYNGEELISETTAAFGDIITLDSLTELTQTGYTFTGWVDAEGNAVTEDITVTKDITLYASWTEEDTDTTGKYNQTFDLEPDKDGVINGGTSDSNDTAGSTDDGSSDTDSSDTQDTDSTDTESSDTGSSDTGNSDINSSDTQDTDNSDTGNSDTGNSDTGNSDDTGTDTGNGDADSTGTGSSDTNSSDTGSGDTDSNNDSNNDSDTGNSDTDNSGTESSDTDSGNSDKENTGNSDSGSTDSGNADTDSTDETDTFTGVRKLSDGNWYYVENDDDVIDYTGLVRNDGTYGAAGWYYVVNGKVDFSYTGLVKHDATTGGKAGWYYVKNGYVNFEKTGLVYNPGTVYGAEGWFYVKNAYVDFSFSSLVKHTDGNWYAVKNGYVNFSVTGLVKNDGTYGIAGWYYVENAVVKFSYSGLTSNTYGSWYVKNGYVDFTYSGPYVYNTVIFTIENGQVVA